MKIISEKGIQLFTITFVTTLFIFFTFSFFVPGKQISTAKNVYRSTAISCSPGISQNSIDSLLEEVRINNNHKPAGEFRNGVYYINLEARMGNWYPETHDGAPIKIKAFAEMGKPLQVPGPLIRVPEGTQIKAVVRNSIKG